MNIIHATTYAIDQKVDVVINSANGYLLHDSSGAGKIREYSTQLTKKELEQYYHLINKLNEKTRNLFLRIADEHNWHPHHVNLSAIKLLLKSPIHRYKKGDAVFDKDWTNKTTKTKVIHAITVTYQLTTTSRKRSKATKTSIKRSLIKSLHIAKKIKATSIALPVPCVRKGYGITPQQSYSIVQEVLDKHGQFLKKAVICFDNEESRAYMKQKLRK